MLWEIVPLPQLAARDRWRSVKTERAAADGLLPPAIYDDVESPMVGVPPLSRRTRSLLIESEMDGRAVNDAIRHGLATKQKTVDARQNHKSARTEWTVTPLFSSSTATSSAADPRPVATTLWPWSASWRAISVPMPLEAPVTSANGRLPADGPDMFRSSTQSSSPKRSRLGSLRGCGFSCGQLSGMGFLGKT